jgi:hypothetical protein
VRSPPSGLPGRDCGKRNAGDAKHRRHHPCNRVLLGSLVCVRDDDRPRRTVFFQVPDGGLPRDQDAVGGDPLRIGAADMGRPEAPLGSRSVSPRERDRIGDCVIAFQRGLIGAGVLAQRMSTAAAGKPFEQLLDRAQAADLDDAERVVPEGSAWGNVTRTTVPRPGSLAISKLPPWSSTRFLVRGSPKPVPSWVRVMAFSI